jgi:hypothetical protein
VLFDGLKSRQRPLHIGGENPLHAQTLVDASLKH